MKIEIGKLDKNLVANGDTKRDDAVFYDVRKAPFSIYGVTYDEAEGCFRRMPKEVAEKVSDGVLLRSTRAAGGRLRFSTDAEKIRLSVKFSAYCHLSYFAESGANGFDLYLDDPGTKVSRFVKLFPFEPNQREGYESEIVLSSRKLRCFTIHLSSYAAIADLQIGLPSDAVLGPGLSYRPTKPIVYYGSSITQGACASHPGNTYENIVCRKTDMDYLNLGFSAMAKGEPAMAEYIASLPQSVFVLDYDHNAPNVDHLKNTHQIFFNTYRRLQPDVPVIMLSRPGISSLAYQAIQRRKDVILETYRNTRENGDKNVYYIDGESMFRGPYEDLCLVDAVHPNDLGFALMADAILAVLERIGVNRNL